VVIDPPTIVGQPTNLTVNAGGTAVFAVSAGGTSPLSYQWQKNGSVLTDGGNVSGSATATLTLTSVSLGDMANYSVVVTNVAGSMTSSNATLTVAAPPTITTQPISSTNLVGTSASFTVAASGSAPLSYQWDFKGTNLSGAISATLTLTNVQLTQAGNYAVWVTNLYGVVLSSNALLIVNPAPTNVPVIFSFSPHWGVTGTVVNVSGLNFDPVPGNNVVYFGAVRAAVTAASVTNLTVSVPVGATYGHITETVNGLVAYSGGVFEPTFPGNGSNLGVSSFAARQDIMTPDGPIGCAVGDLDGDGRPDLVVAGAVVGQVSVYQNLSTGGALGPNTFGPRIDLPLEGTPRSVTLADVDGDGKLDIVVADTGLNQILIYRNLSSGGLLTTNSFAAPVALNVGPDTRYVRVADLDGDGRPDLICASYDNNTVSIFQNIGAAGSLATNSFAPRVDLACAGNALDVVVADLDGDGKPDLAVANFTASVLSIFRNVSTPGVISTNSFAPRVDLPAVQQNASLLVADVDGDGKLDLLASSSSATAISVYRNQASPGSLTTNSFAPMVTFAIPGWGHELAAGDLAGDGKPDIAVTEQDSDLLSLFQNESVPGSFTNTSFGTRVDMGTGSNPFGVTVADLVGDGRPDIIFCNSYGSSISMYQNVTTFGGLPVITQQPTNQTVASGNLATFTVTATGTPPLSYQWNFNGTNIAGATAATLTLTNVQASQAENYSVLVTNELGSVVSSNAVLTVMLVPPDITAEPSSVTNIAGTMATFFVTATGSLPLSYEWQKNGSPMKDVGNVSGSATASLTLTNVQDADVAGYTVVITNVAGSVTSSVANLARIFHS